MGVLVGGLVGGLVGVLGVSIGKTSDPVRVA